LTTLAPLYSWTVNVAGTLADVENLLPADVGPHEFQFRPRDLKKVQQANLVILNGLGVETWLERTFQNNSGGDRTPALLRVSDGWPDLIYSLPTLEIGPQKGAPGHIHTDAHDHDDQTVHADTSGRAPNPHVWLDPVFARHAVSNIVLALCERDPAHAAGFTANARIYLEKLNHLDSDIQNLSSQLRQRTLLTFHDAFPYFARRYGFELVGVVEQVPSVSPSPKYLSALSRVIRDRGVKVIFTEPQYEPRLVKQLSKDLGITFTELDVLETGRPSAEFYLDGMRRNLRTLQTTLK